jgi:hypothetical protein
VQVHFWGWPCTYDEWLPENRLRPAGTQVESALVWAKSALGGLKQLVWWPCKLFLRRPETEDGLQGLHAEKNALVCPYGLRIPPWKNLLHYTEGNKSPSASYKAPQLMWVSRDNIAPFSGPKASALADETLQAAGNGFSGRFGSTVTMQVLDAAIQLARDDTQASDREILFIGHGTVPAANKPKETAGKRSSPSSSIVSTSAIPPTARVIVELPAAAAPVPPAASTVNKQAAGIKRKRPETVAPSKASQSNLVTVVRYAPEPEPESRADVPEKFIDDLGHLQRCIDRRRLLEFGDSVANNSQNSTSAWDQSNFTHLIGGGRYWTTGEH